MREKIERDVDRQIGAASALMRFVYQTAVVKKELSRKSKLSLCRSVDVPTLTYGHESWAVTEKTRLWIQAALRRVVGRSLGDRSISRQADSPF